MRFRWPVTSLLTGRLSAAIPNSVPAFVKAQTPPEDGTSALPYTPEHAFTLWSQYQATDAIAVGAGARYVGSMHRGSDGAVGTPSYTEGYWVADAKVGYRINRNLDLQLNVYNLFDTDYVASINKSGYRYHRASRGPSCLPPISISDPRRGGNAPFSQEIKR